MNAAQTSAGGTVRFQLDVPEVIELEFARGKQVTSRFGGDQVMFSLTDGRRMYLPPIVADRIEAAGIGAHRPFAICKREVSHGGSTRRSVEYQIETINGPAEPSRDSAVPQAAVKATMSRPQDNSTPATPPPPPSAPRATAAAAAGGDDMDLAAMIYAHIRAIDVAAAAESYAAERGLAIRYTSEDVRAIAATLFIQASKGGAR